MKTVEEVRLERLRMLVEDFGSLAALNRATGKTERDSTYSQILNRSLASNTGRPKTMGSSMARQIERSLGKPKGWMDTSPSQSASSWPFSSISLNDIERLSEGDRRDLETTIKRFVAGCLAQQSTK